MEIVTKAKNPVRHLKSLALVSPGGDVRRKRGSCPPEGTVCFPCGKVPGSRDRALWKEGIHPLLLYRFALGTEAISGTVVCTGRNERRLEYPGEYQTGAGLTVNRLAL